MSLDGLVEHLDNDDAMFHSFSSVELIHSQPGQNESLTSIAVNRVPTLTLFLWTF